LLCSNEKLRNRVLKIKFANPCYVVRLIPVGKAIACTSDLENKTGCRKPLFHLPATTEGNALNTLKQSGDLPAIETCYRPNTLAFGWRQNRSPPG
jgi:hypothetical protein